MTFEFDIEVRPDFDMPQWKGLKIERPTRDFTDKDVDAQMQRLLAQRGRLVPHEGAAKPGDYISVNITFQDGDNVISKTEEQILCIRPTLSFRDGNIEKFDKLMTGVKAGETRTANAKLSENTSNEALRGKPSRRTFEVLEVKKLQLPELTACVPGRTGRLQIGRRSAQNDCAKNCSGNWNITSNNGRASKSPKPWWPAPVGICRRRC